MPLPRPAQLLLTEAIFSRDPVELVEKFGFQLATAHFQPGDVILFGMFMMHSSAPNRTDRYRISIDTRYQPATQEKGERFFGENGKSRSLTVEEEFLFLHLKSGETSYFINTYLKIDFILESKTII